MKNLYRTDILKCNRLFTTKKKLGMGICFMYKIRPSVLH